MVGGEPKENRVDGVGLNGSMFPSISTLWKAAIWVGARRWQTPWEEANQ